MQGELVVCSLSPHKLAAAKLVFGVERVVGKDVDVSFNPPQPVGDEFGLICACMRLQATPGDTALAIESFLRVSKENEVHDVVCAVLRTGGRMYCEMGGEILVPASISKQLLDDASHNRHSLAGFGMAVSSVFVHNSLLKGSM